MVGTLLDLIDVDEADAAAFEAAADAALRAVVVRDADTARHALERLRDGDLDGAVLVAHRSTAPPAAIAGGTALRPSIRAVDSRIDPLLDALFGGVAVADDWRTAVDLALAHPAAVIVTRQGDRFGPAGWRIGAGAVGATRVALEEAERRRNDAAVAVDHARSARDAARSAADAAQREAAEAGAALDANDARLQAASDALQRALRDVASAGADAEDLVRHLTELDERIELDRQHLAELETALAHHTEAEQQLQAEVRERRAAMAELEERSRAVGALRSDLEVRAASIDQRRTYLTRRHGELEQRLAAHEAERAQAEQRRAGLERAEAAVTRLTEIVAGHLATVDARLEVLRERRRRHNEATRALAERLETLRRDRHAAERSLEVVREQQRRAEIEEAEARIKLESLTEALRSELDIEPAEALAASEPEVAEGVTARQRARDLERDLRLMGPINPLALEEFDALTERHQFLDGQLEDVKTTRRDLAKVIRKIDDEIVEVFRGAFVDVAENFERLFATLFPGGKGRLLLTDPDDLLNTGVEIEAKPAGKNVKQLSLLSGGERSLTAMAYLFAIFRSRPSPFYVLDEVEAALDDINLHRFLDLVAEFRKEAQLVIVSHQKRTMEAADCLYGVSMRPGGSSKVVSERLSRTA